MKLLIAIAVAVACLFTAPALRAQQSPDDQYIIIYVLIQQGDSSLDAGQPQQALQDYQEAQRELQKFAQVYSDWNPKIVAYRLNYLSDKITALTPQVPSTNAPPVAVAPPPTPEDWQAQLATLNSKLQHLEGDNQTLDAKLKEALSAQPATVSAAQYDQMQEQVRELTKENDLLRSTVAQATNAASIAPPASPVPQNNSPSQQSLAQEQQALAQETALAEQLGRDNNALKARISTLTTDTGAADALREENALLKKELAGLNSASAAKGISEVQSEAAADWLEKTALEDRLRHWQRTVPGREIMQLRARVAMEEAQPVPFTAQELALFSPQPATGNMNTENLPAGAAVLVAEAQSYESTRQYGKAADDLRQAMQSDPNNASVQANLASVELEQNQTADADKHIQAAFAQDPNNSFVLSVLGRVRFSEGNYDAALDALSRAAQLDPQNAQIENFLGVALAQKGQRAQAETAFRKAVDIEPDYGDAHKNLTIFYLSSNPPQIELARWHYEKALAAGVPPNADLEKMLHADSAAPQK